MSQFKLALRSLAKTPFVTAVAILSLALGIGANAAIFSLFDQALLKTLNVQEPERLVNLANPGPKPGSQSCGQAGDCQEVFSYEMFRDLESAQSGFSGVAAHVAFGANPAHASKTTSMIPIWRPHPTRSSYPHHTWSAINGATRAATNPRN